MQSQPDLEVKLVIVGDSEVGKTCLMQTFLHGHIPSRPSSSAFENKVTHCKIGDHIVKLSIWDTSGKPDYDRLRPLCYTRADVFFVCFAVDNPKSFYNALTGWSPYISSYNPETPQHFLCTKYDLAINNEKIDFNHKPPILPYYMMERKIVGMGHTVQVCSAETGFNVEECFLGAATIVGNKIFGNRFGKNGGIGCNIF